MSNVILQNSRLAERHFPEKALSQILFRWFVVSPKNHIIERQLVESLKCRIVKLPKLFGVKRYFPESSFSQTSFHKFLFS